MGKDIKEIEQEDLKALLLACGASDYVATMGSFFPRVSALKAAREFVKRVADKQRDEEDRRFVEIHKYFLVELRAGRDRGAVDAAIDEDIFQRKLKNGEKFAWPK